jgi:hypothetical protein
VAIEPQAFPQSHGGSGIDLKPLEIHAAGDNLNWTPTAIRLTDLKQPLPRSARQNNCGVGLRNEKSLHALNQPEESSPLSPEARIDILVGHQSSNVENKSGSQKPLEDHCHSCGHVPPRVDDTHAPRADEKRSIDNTNDDVGERGGERRPFMVP